MKLALLTLALLFPLRSVPARASVYDDGIADGRATCGFFQKTVDPDDVANVHDFHDDPHRFLWPASPNYRVVGYDEGYAIGQGECGRAAVLLANQPKAAWACVMSIEEAELTIVGTGAGATSKEAARATVLACAKGNPQNPTSCFDRWIQCFHRQIP
jgi:hypothetical protein